MTIKELQFYMEFISDYYGDDFIQDYEHLSEILLLEFDIEISAKDLKILISYYKAIEEQFINLKNCGVSY